MVELTSFRGDDERCLVAASLACRMCLSGEVDWTLEVDDFDGQAHCRCRSCGHRRVITLTYDQALRLSLERPDPLGVA